MPPRVDFYLVTQTNWQACLALLCQLTEKVYAATPSLLILTEQADVLTKLDQALWTYAELSFLPHALWSQHPAAPIILGDITQYTQIPARSILMNLTQTLPIGEHTRILEIIPEDAHLRAAGRIRFKHYREQGSELFTHHV